MSLVLVVDPNPCRLDQLLKLGHLEFEELDCIDPFDSMAMDISIKKRLPFATLMEDWAKPLEDLGKGKEVESEMTLEE